MELQGFSCDAMKVKRYGLDGGKPQWKSELLKWGKKRRMMINEEEIQWHVYKRDQLT